MDPLRMNECGTAMRYITKRRNKSFVTRSSGTVSTVRPDIHAQASAAAHWCTMNRLNLERAVAMPDCVDGARSSPGLAEVGYDNNVKKKMGMGKKESSR